MSDQVLKYRDQIGSMEIDADDCCLHGKLLYINDLVTYESDSVDGLRREFEAAVDDYLETCAELGQEPNKPFKGSFNVRIGPELHKSLAYKASELGINTNEAVIKAVSEFVQEAPSSSDLLNDVRDNLKRYVFEYQSQYLDISQAHSGSTIRRRESQPSRNYPSMKGTSFVIEVSSANGH